MKTNYLSLICLLFLAVGCGKKESDALPPKTPSPVSYDFNDDQINDFTIKYNLFSWEGSSTSGNVISGTIEPMDQNAVLKKQSGYTLFNQVNDTIKTEVASPLYWENNPASEIVNISNSSIDNFLWPKVWRIQSVETQNYYYLGVKIIKDEKASIGWLKLTIDQSSGLIKIVDKQFSSNDFIVIYR